MKLSVFFNYLIACVLSMAAVRLANMADAALVGNIISAEGLAGVVLCQPVMQVIFSLYTLLVLSSAVLMGIAIGHKDREKATRLLAFGLKAGFLIGVSICLLGYLFFDDLSHILCKSEELRPHTNAYLRVILLGAIPQMGMYALNQFVTVDGSPVRVSWIAVFGNMINICLDVLFMKYLGMGVEGAALATLIMYVVCIILLLGHHFQGPDGVWKAVMKTRNVFSHISEVVAFGTPMFLSTALLTLQFYSNNTIATTFLGTDGMVILAVCMQLYDFSLIILTGAMNTTQALGSRLCGEDDNPGLLRMYGYIYVFLALSTLAYSGVISLFPEHISSFLGAKSAVQTALANHALPAFSLYLVLMPMAYLLLPAYQFFKRKTLCYVHSLGVTLIPPAGFAIWTLLDRVSCWWGLALGESAVLVLLFLITLVIRRRNPDLILMLLIKKQ